MNVNYTALAIFAVGLITVTYLVYRFMRYSDWRQTPVGRSFLGVKAVLLVMYLYVLVAPFLSDEARAVWRWVLIGSADVALLYTLRTVVRFQGGWRRVTPVTEDSRSLESGQNSGMTQD